MILLLKLSIPKYVEEAINSIEKAGFEAFVVGGALRDILLGREPTDWDITTNALVDDIKIIFKKHFETGIAHGTLTVLVDNIPIEVTTYRIDGEYLDNRRPASVEFTNNLYEDLKRRDFTINALAYNPKSGIVDLFNGKEDLEKGIIRCIGSADERFNEDALRILRGLRFSAMLNFDIESETLASISKNKNLLKNISAERINVELTKLFLSDNRLELLFDTGVGEVILPEVAKCFSATQNNPHHIYDVGIHTLCAVRNMPKTVALRFAALLHDVGKPETKTTDENDIDHFYGHNKASEGIARTVLNRLKFDNKTKDRVLKLVLLHDREIQPTEKLVRRAVSKIGKETFEDLLLLKRADALAQNPELVSEKLFFISQIEKIYKNILDQKQPLSLRDLAVNGADMQKIGIFGKEIGDTLSMLLDKVLENPTINNKEKLIILAKEHIK